MMVGRIVVLESSHGLHPRHFRVRPFCDQLERIRDLLIKKSKQKVNIYTDGVSFNHLKIKLYCVKDIFFFSGTGDSPVPGRSNIINNNKKCRRQKNEGNCGSGTKIGTKNGPDGSKNGTK